MPFQPPATVVTLPLGKKSLSFTVGPTPHKKKHLPHLGATEICDPHQQLRISSAFGYAATLNGQIRAMGGACEALADKMRELTLNEVTVSCDLCDPPTAESSSDLDLGTMSICKFPQDLSELVRIVMREQVYLAGGYPIDMWAVDGWIWCRDSGGLATRPDPRALPAMCAGSDVYYDSFGNPSKERYGTYVFWDPVYGNLWSRAKGAQVNSYLTLFSGSNYYKYAC
jgi:hypothetical protein